MDSIFSDDENVFCCIDNILLVAHDGFEDHLNQIDEVSSRLTNNNVQTHIEETFLAASSFDYLGCRLTHHGIKIQEKMNEGYFKHCATRCSLRITPTHRLCSMLPRHASPKKWRASSSNVSNIQSIKKITWTPEMDTSFNHIKRVVSQNASLACPNFNLPFRHTLMHLIINLDLWLCRMDVPFLSTRANSMTLSGGTR